MNWEGKSILITAGPTWVPIDKVRVISNIASGRTGILLAQECSKRGARVSLFLGPVSSCCLRGSIRLVRFSYFEELKAKIMKELKKRRYDFIVHSAAVSDFRPQKKAGSKISSGAGVSLKLKPLPKIIGCIKRLSRDAQVTIFKLECGVADATLIKRAQSARDKYNAEFVVANRLEPYRAFIIDRRDRVKRFASKEGLVNGLLNAMSKR